MSSFWSFCGGIELPFNEESFLAAITSQSFFDQYGFSLCQSDDEYWLCSNCGLYQLEIEFQHDQNMKAANAVDIIADTILSSEIYKYVLKDVSFGAFTKSELYWAYYLRFVIPSREATLKRHRSDFSFRLFSFETDFEKTAGDAYYYIDACDEYCTEIYTRRLIGVDLNSAIRIIAEDVMSIGVVEPDLSIFDFESEYNNESIGICFTFKKDVPISVPKTENELLEWYRSMVFAI